MPPSWYEKHAPDSLACQAEAKLAVMAIVHLQDGPHHCPLKACSLALGNLRRDE